MKLDNRIAAELTPGEEVLWLEKPGLWALLLEKESIGSLVFPVVVFSVLFYATGRNRFFVFIGVVMALLSLYWWIVNSRILYVITTKRLMIVNPAVLSKVTESYYPPDIDFIKTKKRRNGSGSLLFSAIRERGKRTHTVEIGFFGIRNVDGVEALVRDLRK